MSSGDKALRTKAIPFESVPFVTIGGITGLGFGGSLVRLNALAYTKPHAGDLVEARFTLSLTAPAAEGFNLRVAIGSFSDEDLNIETDYTESYIDRMHRRLTGKSEPFSVAAGGNLFIDELDLTRAIPRRGNGDYNDEGFVVLLVLDEEPADGDEFQLLTLRCLCSAQMGLL